ncbi:MAG: FtsX-like permease family protein [Burkholderiales bacterium]|nr:FtsX-like permease family protein [Burkholderiales bacterium]MDE2393915.1 FtsX-like permease family protein [Burkholderiales bacterium]MDE2452025.1 FtsX-like permease family protein [Burkholderiales bacterium]
MNTLLMALRNLARNRRRSATTLLAMVIGLAATLVFGGYRANIAYGMETGFVQGSGHLQIQRRGYFVDGSDNPGAYGIDAPQRIIAALHADPVLAPLLRVVSPSLQLGGIAGNFEAGISRSVLALGVDVPSYNRMLQWNDYGLISYAKPLALPEDQPDAVVVGEGVARKLGLCAALGLQGCVAPRAAAGPASGAAAMPADIAALAAGEQPKTPAAAGGSHIELLVAGSRGAPNVAGLDVVKAKNMGIKALDDVFVAMHLARAQKLIYGAAPPKVTAITVQLNHTAELPAARARIEQLLAARFGGEDLAVVDFAQLNPTYGQSLQFMNSMFGFIAVLIGAIVLFTIGNTMSTAVVERTVEIGTLRAIGLDRGGLRRLFLCEGLLLGLGGAALGLLVAWGVATAINHSGLTWTPPGYAYAYKILVLLWQDPRLIVGSVVGLVAVTLVSAWFPAHRAARLMIVDALRHV